ncbi:unnamed protein product [Diabrotica balteata]|uniref:Uncharacterized protein n=1 Tax=Diabrotica balteata TaxID=107213 RepID=A0A9N9TG28_DIABA|nr:unnamed protein product [Diabrotica balteata]
MECHATCSPSKAKKATPFRRIMETCEAKTTQLNKNFDFDLIMFDYYMPPNKDLYLEYLKCNEKWRNTKLPFTEKVWRMIKCVYQQDPANFVFV